MRRLIITALLFAAAAGCNCGQGQPGPGGGPGPGNTDAGVPGNGNGDGGTGDDAGAQACVPGAQAIQVTPSDQSVTIAGGETFQFNASAVLTTGSQDITHQATWTVTRADDSPTGTIADGVYTPPPGTGGLVTVMASDGCISGQTTITLRLQSSAGNPDAGTVAAFGGTVDTTTTANLPVIVYPNDQTRFPRNIYKVLFQWNKAGNTQFRLTFDGPYSTTTVYTDGSHPDCAGNTAAGCWEADAQTWQAIAGSNAGGVSHLTVDGIRSGDAKVYRSKSIDIGFSRRDVRGAIFYWSTTAAGVRRASVSDANPEAYVVAQPVPTTLSDGSTVKCVACHTVSRSGRKLFGGTQTSATSGEYVYDVTLDPPPNPIITTQISTQNKGFGTFSPDDERVVATLGNLLAEYMVDGGVKVGNLPVAAGTNPDWSPAGDLLAYSDVGGDSPANANLSVVTRDGGVWTNPHVLVAGGGVNKLTNLFPSFSPDGEFIAYSRGKGGHGDKTLQLWLAKSDGTAAPVELLTANRVLNNCVGVTCDANGRTNGQYENNMPTWAPPGDLQWVAFNSLRPYGLVYPNGGTQQIWVTAIDPNKLGAVSPDGGAVDPSYPAFRFAFQDLSENNHRAFWTLDVRVPEPDAGACLGSGATCGPNSVCCDGLSCEGGELGFVCAPPPADAGSVCLNVGDPCSQTGGASCCSGLVCDVGADAGTMCRPVIQ